jgi:hypothetical protein
MVLGDRIERARYHGRLRDRQRQLALFMTVRREMAEWRATSANSTPSTSRSRRRFIMILTPGLRPAGGWQAMLQASWYFSFLVAGICRYGRDRHHVIASLTERCLFYRLVTDADFTQRKPK